MTAFAPAIAWVAGFAAALLGSGLFIRRPRSVLYRGIGLVALATAFVQFANSVGLFDPTVIALWRRIGMAGELAQAVALLYVGLSIVETTMEGPPVSTVRRTYAIAAAAAVLVVLVPFDWTLHLGQDGLFLGPLGRLDYAFILFALAVALA